MDASAVTPPIPQDTEKLYRHSRRKEWGLAIVAWTRPTRRGYQFADGKLRVIKQGYYGLLREVDKPASQASEIIEELQRQAGISRARRRARGGTRASGTPPVRLEEQIALFRRTHPDGFEEPGWREEVRGEGAPRRLKRHRDPAIADAQLVDSDDGEDLRAGSHEQQLVEPLQLGLLERTFLDLYAQ